MAEERKCYTRDELTIFQQGSAQITIHSIHAGLQDLTERTERRFDNADIQYGWDTALDAVRRLLIGLSAAIHEGKAPE